MIARVRWLLIAATVVVAVVLFVVLRPDDDDRQEDAAPRRSVTIVVGTPEPGETEPTQTTPTRSRRIGVTVVDGRPRGGIVRETLEQGERVVLVVRADVRDHVHLHGYDVMRDVGPGTPAQLAFTADIVGRFEVELEDRRLLIAELEVVP